MPASGHPYSRQRIGIATIHAKERAAGPPFRRLLGAELVVAPHVNTDLLGTFSGEIPRSAPIIETCLTKAEMAFATLPDFECALASEGSYGPIDRVPMTPSGLEVMAFIDRKRGLRIVETLVTNRTNWRLFRFEAGDPRVAEACRTLRFPEYSVFVIRNSDYSEPVKELATVPEVVAAVDREARRSADGLAMLVSDMRAHKNPMRMQVLRALAWKLARRLRCLCPKCHSPGFGEIERRRGLPCGACGEPTHFTHFAVDACSACGHAMARPRDDGLKSAPPLSCRACRSRTPQRAALQGARG